MNKYLKLDTGNKAKEDIDFLMAQHDFQNVAIGSNWHGKVGRFFAKLLSVVLLPMKLNSGDVLLVQYPFKKYYPSLCRIAHLRGAKVVTLIHDLGCFRRKKLTVEEEIKKLCLSDVLIVHNESMQKFLTNNGYKRPMLTLNIFDYLAPDAAQTAKQHNDGELWDVVYAGGLAERKNAFLYKLDEQLPEDCCWTLHIHGKGLNEQKASAWKHIKPRGFIKSDDFIKDSVGHFGLVWDGSSIDECAGDWGVYLKVNNPHKTSFYLRSGKPVIIWRDAALAAFVEREGVGLTVGSLQDIDKALKQISAEEYAEMGKRAQAIAKRLSEGFYFYNAFDRALTLL